MNTQVVFITGALTGIGRAAAIAFAQDGARVVVSGRRDKEGQELAAELEGLGAEAIFVHTDVRNERDVQDLVDTTRRAFGSYQRRSQLCWNRGQTWPGDGTDRGNLRRDLRHQRPGHAAQHEA
jgi:NAD(P)-dependent dehydrogenase (short-subunit alcohol dehydrogenase family)